jgi:hypothetical protein
MVLNLAATLFVLALTFLHSMFGLYSGIINVFCSIVSLCVAFGFYEPVMRLLTDQLQAIPPTYAAPGVLVLLFLLTLFILRTLADNYLRGNVHVNAYVDWGGGGVCGFINAQIAVGVITTGFLMLPWGGSVAMYHPIERDPDDSTYAVADNISPEERRQDERIAFRRNRLWLRSDEFAAGLFSILSRGSLSSGTSFAKVYPDFPQWVHWTGNQIQHEAQPAPTRSKKRGDGFEDGLSVESWWKLEPGEGLPADRTVYRAKKPGPEDKRSRYAETPAENLPPFENVAYEVQPGRRLIGVRVFLRDASADQEKDFGYHRFRPTNLRLVGDIRQPDGSLVPAQYTPQVIGGGDQLAGVNLRIVDPDNNFSIPPAGQNKLELYFETDRDFEPRFVEYRRYARAAISGPALEERPTDIVTPVVVDSSGQIRASGVTRFLDTIIPEMTGAVDRLPFAMSRQNMGGAVEIRAGRLASMTPASRIKGFRDELEGTGAGTVEYFATPSRRRLFQVQAYTRKMQSLGGQVMNFVASTTNQYFAVDSTGERHMLAGYYAIVPRGNRQYVELYYNEDPEGTGSRGMVELDTQNRRALREEDDAILGLLFVIPPGRCIERIETSGRGKVEFGEPMCVGQ